MSRSIVTGLMAMMAVPLLAVAAASAQQDYLDATNATPDLVRGERLFAACAGCHGPDGGGNAKGDVPRIGGQHARVLIRQLVDYRYDNRRDPQMEGVASGHRVQTAVNIADVATYAASLRPRVAAGNGPGDQLEQGARLYRARCSSCHGAAGQGDANSPVPRLAGQHYAYLLRQFHDALEGRRPQLARSHNEQLKDLDRDALQALADSLSRMPAAPR